jgi:hypothetical protein
MSPSPRSRQFSVHSRLSPPSPSVLPPTIMLLEGRAAVKTGVTSPRGGLPRLQPLRTDWSRPRWPGNSRPGLSSPPRATHMRGALCQAASVSPTTPVNTTERFPIRRTVSRRQPARVDCLSGAAPQGLRLMSSPPCSEKVLHSSIACTGVNECRPHAAAPCARGRTWMG